MKLPEMNKLQKGLAVVWIVLALALLIYAVASAGLPGLAAVISGLVGTGLFISGTWGLIYVLGKTAAGEALPPQKLFLAVMGVLIKLPAIGLGWAVSKQCGPSGPTLFLLGLALVYSALAGWGVSRR